MIKSLKLVGCISLSAIECQYNQIENINLTNCESLSTLKCSDNIISELNLEGCASLKSLYCANNNLEVLDLSKTGLGIISSSYLDCAPNASLSKLYLKTGSNISGVTTSRSTSNIPAETEIIYVD
jgi:Leucine-rich repeat (LRR) protein